MSPTLRVSSLRFDGILQSNSELQQMLSTVDSEGGGDFWLTLAEQEFPCLSIRTSAGQADVHYFPTKEHPGFRRMADNPGQSDWLFRFEGCDPSVGELIPKEFVLTLAEALNVAEYFMQQGRIIELSKWFEL
jgi:hypothetical protein